MSDFSTNPYAYPSAVVTITALGAAAAFSATHDAVNRGIMIARSNSIRQQVAKRIRRDRAERCQLERDLAVAKCDAALARWHLRRLAERQREVHRF